MITSGIMKILHDSIQVYDELCEKKYFIIFGSKKITDCVEIAIKQSAFWHLLGCSLDNDTPTGKRNTYLKCKNKEDVSDKIFSKHSFSEIQEKAKAMKETFNFIEKANQIRIDHVSGCPEEYMFQIGIGNGRGIIGYDHTNQNSLHSLVPKSAQLKSITKISKNPLRIQAILSKNISDRDYRKIEYEVKKGICEQIQARLSLPNILKAS